MKRSLFHWSSHILLHFSNYIISHIIKNSVVMSEKVCKILLRPSPPAWGPQAGGEFVMLIFICRFT